MCVYSFLELKVKGWDWGLRVGGVGFCMLGTYMFLEISGLGKSEGWRSFAEDGPSRQCDMGALGKVYI